MSLIKLEVYKKYSLLTGKLMPRMYLLLLRPAVGRMSIFTIGIAVRDRKSRFHCGKLRILSRLCCIVVSRAQTTGGFTYYDTVTRFFLCFLVGWKKKYFDIH